MEDKTYDAIIIGTGMSGLSAANNLLTLTSNILILDGRSRIGGLIMIAAIIVIILLTNRRLIILIINRSHVYRLYFISIGTWSWMGSEL